MQDEPSCFDDISVLFRDGTLFDVGFFCDVNLQSNRFWNRLIRFITLYIFCIGILHQNQKLILLGFVNLLMLIVVNRFRHIKFEKMAPFEQNKTPEVPKIATCYKVSEENPFGNPSVGFKNEIPTCKYQSEQSNEYFFKNLPVSPLDPFRRQAQPRQFYTVPNTTDINKQTEFANWLYN